MSHYQTIIFFLIIVRWIFHICVQRNNGNIKDPILFNTLPKSGTVFINAFLSSLLESKTILAPINQFPNSTIHWKTIENLQNINSFVHGHFPASPENIEVLKNNFSKVILHLRDPKAVYSWYRFIEQLRKYRSIPIQYS